MLLANSARSMAPSDAAIATLGGFRPKRRCRHAGPADPTAQQVRDSLILWHPPSVLALRSVFAVEGGSDCTRHPRHPQADLGVPQDLGLRTACSRNLCCWIMRGSMIPCANRPTESKTRRRFAHLTLLRYFSCGSQAFRLSPRSALHAEEARTKVGRCAFRVPLGSELRAELQPATQKWLSCTPYII